MVITAPFMVVAMFAVMVAEIVVGWKLFEWL